MADGREPLAFRSLNPNWADSLLLAIVALLLLAAAAMGLFVFQSLLALLPYTVLHVVSLLAVWFAIRDVQHPQLRWQVALAAAIIGVSVGLPLWHLWGERLF